MPSVSPDVASGTERRVAGGVAHARRRHTAARCVRRTTTSVDQRQLGSHGGRADVARQLGDALERLDERGVGDQRRGHFPQRLLEGCLAHGALSSTAVNGRLDGRP